MMEVCLCAQNSSYSPKGLARLAEGFNPALRDWVTYLLSSQNSSYSPKGLARLAEGFNPALFSPGF